MRSATMRWTALGCLLALSGCEALPGPEDGSYPVKKGEESLESLEQGINTGFSCGPHLTTYRVTAGWGEAGNGVRCVKFGEGFTGQPLALGPTFSWYGEGAWGGRAYRHLGEASLTSTGLVARFADFYGNGETSAAHFDNGEMKIALDPGTPPPVIRIDGPWSETWTRVDRVAGYVPLAPVRSCGPHFEKFRAEGLSRTANGFGIRCKLKGTDTWYGEGQWNGRRYAHLGMAARTLRLVNRLPRFLSRYGASDLCKPGTAYCNQAAFGALSLAPRDFPHVGRGYELTGWAERWLPYARRYAVRVDAVRVSDSPSASSSAPRQAAVAPADISRWVDYANLVYQAADVEFLFVEQANGPDFRDLQSTPLNTLTGEEHPDWANQRAIGNHNATPGKLTVYVRYGGPDASSGPTGGGFSSTGYDFVAMPGFHATWLCGQDQNLGLFAHETGHYLGLGHTFAATFDTVAQATQYFRDHRRSREAFEGDGLTDTLTDPFIGALQCNDDPNVVLDGETFTLPRTNIMGYWASRTPHTTSPQQNALVHERIRLRGLD